MKKIFMALVIASAFATVANAQEAKAEAPAAAKPQLSKEEKAKVEQKRQDDLAAAFKEAGFTDAEAKQAKEVIEAAKAKRNEIKKSTATEEEKTKQTQEVKDAEKAKLIEIVGKDKYKLFKETQKKQKEAAGN